MWAFGEGGLGDNFVSLLSRHLCQARMTHFDGRSFVEGIIAQDNREKKIMQ